MTDKKRGGVGKRGVAPFEPLTPGQHGPPMRASDNRAAPDPERDRQIRAQLDEMKRLSPALAIRRAEFLLMTDEEVQVALDEALAEIAKKRPKR